MYSFFAGIDVAKDLFSVVGIDGKGSELFTRFHSMDSSGFEELLKAITGSDEDFSRVIVAMESTGCYHINLFSFLMW